MRSGYLHELTETVIGFAIDVHRHLGPSLLESVYEECLCHDLSEQQIEFRQQVALPIVYKGVKLDCGYRMDLLIDGQLVLELKSVDRINPIHAAQLLTYLRLSGHRLGLLMNFNTVLLKDGIRRLML